MFSYSNYFQKTTIIKVLTVILSMLPVFTHAHGIVGEQNGLTHPFHGWDHIVAALAVGLWAAQLGGRSVVVLPLSYFGFATIGFIFRNTFQPSLPFLEEGIIISVLILGVLIIAAARLNLAKSVAIAGAFAWIHGYSHGISFSGAQSGSVIGLKLLLSTAILVFGGVILGLVLRDESTSVNLRRFSVVRTAGIIIFCFGLTIFICS